MLPRIPRKNYRPPNVTDSIIRNDTYDIMRFALLLDLGITPT